MKQGKGVKKGGGRFAEALLRWNATENDRPMPWKGETDPYRIWLSEVILQQTRVEQGWSYYERFLAAFPTVEDLARAPEAAVFKLWEGLGYYARCRNLIAAARRITDEHGGRFPGTYEAILALPGIGPYTAAAIASFAYNLPYAVVDGNVYRVLSRIWNNDTPIDSTAGKRWFAEKAQDELPLDRAAIYNQALMDFGATLCKPVPECARCFYRDHCGAYLHGRQSILPVKAKKTAVRERWFHYILLEHNGAVALHPRSGKDIWQDLWEPLLVEAEHVLSKEELLDVLQKEYRIAPGSSSVISAGGKGRQRLSHQLIHFAFLHLELNQRPALPGFEWVAKTAVGTHPYPKTVGAFLKNV
ncbi:A/G-specific adenine glycosylase [Flaviaesturariibacter flavus]|uniref:Adenine DNA glycosylase n=1 Tax=Flaviaesturariibacter flavus TaxID=2502780 RepID=A0A4R1BAR7_9BACT|nr:A/G-specific adenine glycosylase [Flaviaesturariibacter flavus]TCJ14044.1 A/G-specific adenine glycosylase [Flaviaesturariibacter flavus]